MSHNNKKEISEDPSISPFEKEQNKASFEKVHNTRYAVIQNQN